MVITNVNRAVDSLKFEVSDLDRFKSRIVEAIKTKKVVSARGGFLTLDDKTGIDTLGNMMESSILSPNRAYYGNFHNTGHDAISYVHDPDHRYLVKNIFISLIALSNFGLIEKCFNRNPLE